MSDNLIPIYSSALVNGFIKRMDSLSSLGHKLTKGELRELFVSNILKSFLTSQFDIGSGIIVNHKGEQSKQIDIIIYDNRIIPPLIKQQHIGVFPAESVIATIEVKSNLTKEAIITSESSVRHLYEVVYNPSSNMYKDYNFTPLCALIGFFGNGVSDLTDEQKGKVWLKQNIDKIFSICLTGKYSWINIIDTGWHFHKSDNKYHEETKAFIAVLIDNIRTHAEGRLKYLTSSHRDWLSIYIRHQNLFG